METGSGEAALDPRALRIDDLLRILIAASSEPLTLRMIEDDIASGAPCNPDGTINLAHYAAWLVSESA